MDTNELIDEVIVPIILIVLIFAIIIRVILTSIENDLKRRKEYKKKKEKENNTKNNKIPTNINPNITYKEIDLSKIKDTDILKDNVFKIFTKMLIAYSNKDNETLKKLTNDSLYKTYLNKQNKLSTNNQLEIIKDIVLKEIKILDIKKKKEDYNLKFYIKLSCYNYFTNLKRKKVIRGSNKQKVEQEYLVYLDKIDKNCTISKVVKVCEKLIKKKKNVKK